MLYYLIHYDSNKNVGYYKADKNNPIEPAIALRGYFHPIIRGTMYEYVFEETCVRVGKGGKVIRDRFNIPKRYSSIRFFIHINKNGEFLQDPQAIGRKIQNRYYIPLSQYKGD